MRCVGLWLGHGAAFVDFFRHGCRILRSRIFGNHIRHGVGHRLRGFFRLDRTGCGILVGLVGLCRLVFSGRVCRSFGRSFSSRLLCLFLGFLGGGGFLGLFLRTFGGLFARLALVRVVARITLTNACCIQETGDPVRWLRAYPKPVFRTFFIQRNPLFIILGEQRVVSADLFQIFAIARTAAVGCHDAIIRTLFRAATG